MAVLDEIQTEKKTGKIGCDSCMYWSEYGEQNLELYGFVGRWGRCSSVEQVKAMDRKSLLNQVTLVERLNTNLNRLSIESKILSTTPKFTCPHVKIPYEQQDKKSTNDPPST